LRPVKRVAHDWQRRLQILLLLVLSATLALGCVVPIGDATHEVVLQNSTGEDIVVFTVNRDPRFQLRLRSAQVVAEGWRYPVTPDDRRARRLQADNRGGEQIFCLDVTYEELVRRRWRIDITRGQETCP